MRLMLGTHRYQMENLKCHFIVFDKENHSCCRFLSDPMSNRERCKNHDFKNNNNDFHYLYFLVSLINLVHEKQLKIQHEKTNPQKI
jgi:hypothetical protein